MLKMVLVFCETFCARPLFFFFVFFIVQPNFRLFWARRVKFLAPNGPPGVFFFFFSPPGPPRGPFAGKPHSLRGRAVFLVGRKTNAEKNSRFLSWPGKKKIGKILIGPGKKALFQCLPQTPSPGFWWGGPGGRTKKNYVFFFFLRWRNERPMGLFGVVFLVINPPKKKKKKKKKTPPFSPPPFLGVGGPQNRQKRTAKNKNKKKPPVGPVFFFFLRKFL